ncbi:lactonase family protein [Paenibacillus fonticola]|uniref:lactonase family protein n=1 Tax=Paenibacillus fonticola TaxID=379896 RepID=UPI0003660339|nr:lactonase family protein [Paenibacillus fonticola]
MSIFKPEEQYFYVGGYSSREEAGIHLCSLNTSSGELRLIHGTSDIENPSFLIVADKQHAGRQAAAHVVQKNVSDTAADSANPAIPAIPTSPTTPTIPTSPSADGAGTMRLYAVLECEEGKVAAYSINPQDGKLNLLETVRTDGASPCHLSLSPSGHLLVANYSSGHVNSFELNGEGTLVQMAAAVQHVGSGFRQDRQEAAHAHSAVPSKDGKYAFVSDLGLDQIVIYRLDDGKLVTHREVALPPGAGPRHFIIHPSDTFAYGINELNNTVTVFAYNPTHGILEIIQHISTLPEDFTEESYAADIHLSPDSKYVYASNRGHDSIVRFKLDSSTGQLSAPEWTSAGGKWPRNFAVLDDYVLVANQFSSSITLLRRNRATGSLSPADSVLEVKEPSCIAVVPR